MEKWWLQTYGCEMGTPVTDWNARNLWQGTLNEESISNWANITSSRAWNIFLFYLCVVSSMWEKTSIVDRMRLEPRTSLRIDNLHAGVGTKKSPKCIKWLEFDGLVGLSRCWWCHLSQKRSLCKSHGKRMNNEWFYLKIYVVDWRFYVFWWRHVETCSFISFGW
jgi:hypothetical protein